MKVTTTIAECRAGRAEMGEVALVPTMGALHAGHVSLMELAKTNAAHVAVSIFVNPTQFGPAEDFSRYPRPVDADLALCEKAGVDWVFMPTAAEMYPQGIEREVRIDLPGLTTVLEGRHRPGHFNGVCQVVAKLFNIIRPAAACFGMKDYQQWRVLSAMVEALDFPIRMIAGETVREPDGLAMSSRNRYLSADERERALSIGRSLRLAKEEVQNGVAQTNRLIASIQHALLEQHLNIDYIAAVDAKTLKAVERIDGATALLIAARVGSTRLIDNIVVGAVGS